MKQRSLTLKVNPVPASRPRFVNRGRFVSTYYAGKYKDFKEVTGPAALAEALPKDWIPIDSPCSMEVLLFVAQPKTTKLKYPKPDIDNYLKAVLDLLQPKVITDDCHIIHIKSSKEWSNNPRIELTIHTL